MRSSGATRIAGNSTTSRIDRAARSAASRGGRCRCRSPPVGGIRARAPGRRPRRTAAPPRRRPRRGARCSSKRARWSSGSLSSVNALANSIPPAKASKRSTSPSLGAVALGERRELDRVVEQERRLRSASARRAWTAGGRRAAPRSPRSGTSRPRSRIAAAATRASRSARMSTPVRAPIAPASVSRCHGGVKSSSPVVADRARRRSATSCSQRVGDVVVVGVGLVPLEHRELGVVLGRDALVAEVLADLVDALEAADDQPLEVELGGDPQVERRGRARCGAS